MSLRPSAPCPVVNLQRDLEACREVALQHAADASRTSVMVEMEEERQRKQLKPAVADNLQNVPADGQCLYYCITRLHNSSETTVGQLSVSDMRKELAAHFSKIAREKEFEENYKALVIATVTNNKAIQLERYTYEEAIPWYAKLIEDEKYNEWGGDLELDLAATLFGVIIHRFDGDQVGESLGPDMPRWLDPDPKKARLVRSFYPNQEAIKKDADEKKHNGKWIVVWIANHFRYAKPIPPKTGELPKKDPPTMDDVEAKRREVEEFMKKRKPARPPPMSMNEALRKVHLENKQHYAQQGPACHRKEVDLTTKQEDAVASADKFREQVDEFSKMTQQLQQTFLMNNTDEESQKTILKLRQIDHDAEFALRVSKQFSGGTVVAYS